MNMDVTYKFIPATTQYSCIRELINRLLLMCCTKPHDVKEKANC